MQGAGSQEIKGGLVSMSWKERAALKDMCVSSAGWRAGPHKDLKDEAEPKDTWLIFWKEDRRLWEII